MGVHDHNKKALKKSKTLIMTNSIVFTGGGTAGHVTPNIALIEDLDKTQWQINYIGSENGVEKNIISEINIPYHAIRTGKFRRYFSWQNFLDPLYILLGIIQSFFLLRRLKANIVFSKGGFVAFPVVVGAWLNRIPVIAHESDLTPGLANRLCFPFVNKICVTFAEGALFFKGSKKVVVTGTPIRKDLFTGNRERGLALCNFTEHKPCLLIIGGSLGAQVINKVVRQALPILTKNYQVIHLCGKGKIDSSLQNVPGYCQFEYANEELACLFAASDLVISRAGANSVYEILALQKPHILIPLSAKASRGDQIHNANYFKKQGVSVVIDEEDLSVDTMKLAVEEVCSRQAQIIASIEALGIESATSKIIALIVAQSHVVPRQK